MFLLNLFVLTGGGQNTTTLTDLQVGPPMPTQEDFVEITVDIESLEKQPTQESALEQIAELQKQIEALEAQIECPCIELTTVLQAQIEALEAQIACPCIELTAELQAQIDGLEKQPREELGTLAALQQVNGSWTPVVTATIPGATPPTIGAVFGYYQKTGNSIYITYDVTITNNGTGLGLIQISGLPYNIGQLSFGSGVETAVLGFGTLSNCLVGTAGLLVQKIDGTYPGGTGYRLLGSFTYLT
jgi:hypothetical protein